MPPLNNKYRLGKLKNGQPSEEQIATHAKNHEVVARSRSNKSAAGLVAIDRRERNNLAARVYRAKLAAAKKGCMHEEQFSPVSPEGASTLNTFHCSQCRTAG